MSQDSVRRLGYGFLLDQIATIVGNAIREVEELSREVARLREENAMLRRTGRATTVPDEPE